ncbi:MAG: fused MFS/spermidine synthase [Planctomycetes bacterium]|nr:fused MFS/spermidine synthase [Planctomycetota bacterium]
MAAGPASATASLGAARGFFAAALAGFCLMAAELTAVRLQAPWFGDSAYVWTNVIGVILAALAGGAALGGVLAGRGQAVRTLFRVLALAAVLLALLPFVARPVGQYLLPPELPLDAAMAAVVRGSLVATALLFGPPMLLLGMIGPLLVTALAHAGGAGGRAAGTVSAAGTLGSLLGTFAATHWLVPTFGSRATLTLVGALVGLAAFAVASGKRRAAVGGAVTALLTAAAALHSGPLRPAAGRELLAERETPYQLLQVVREHPPASPDRTLLLINEGLDSFHSIAVAGSALTGGAYYDWHALAPLLAGDGARPDDLRALSIGDAAGSLRTVYAGVFPGATLDGVDIDAETMALGDRFFVGAAGRAAGGRHAADGRVFVNLAGRRWHAIHVDAYANQIYVPAHLASRQFFVGVRELLEPGGVVALNVGGLRDDDPVLRAIGTTLAAVFGHAFALHVPNSRNYLVVAKAGAPPAFDRLTAEPPVGGEALNDADRTAWLELVHYAARPAAWRDVGSGGPVLDDDRPELDELMMQSYVATTDPGAVVACAGGVAPDAAELTAYEAATVGDWLGVLAAVASSRAPTAFLREKAGHARWSMRELRAAIAEYGAARELADDPTARERLDHSLAVLGDELAPQREAAAVTARNGWLALAVVALMLGSVLWIVGLARARGQRRPA